MFGISKVTPVEDPERAMCAICGKTVAREAEACPHCGGKRRDPILVEPPWRSLPLSRRIYWVFIYICGGLLLLGFAWWAISVMHGVFLWLDSLRP